MEKTWDVYVIHHAHTDIGYTEQQETIMRYHKDFIRQAMDILDDAHLRGRSEYDGFVWQCENYWQTENFLSDAEPAERERFIKYVMSGEIGLSGNYLNFNELITAPLLDRALERAERFGHQIGHTVTAAMCADINGMAWGCAELLYRHGIRYFFSALHSHHGMFPLYRKMQPFYWEAPDGNRILVWNGEHYNIGNDLFLAPCGGSSYLIKDEYTAAYEQHTLLNRSAAENRSKELEIAKVRLKRYLENLEKEEYPYDIVPVMVSGVISDNAPPNPGIIQRIRELNESFGGKIRLHMVNLEQFFEQAESRCGDIPVYRGDWTDWWADGAASSPLSVKVYLDAARKYNLCRKLGCAEESQLLRAEQQLLYYAEHTWGHSASVTQPWDTQAGFLELKKDAYAADAHTLVSDVLYRELEKRGACGIRCESSGVYGIYNPHSFPVCTRVCLDIMYWEYPDGAAHDPSAPVSVLDCRTGEILPCQMRRITRGSTVEVILSLKAGEERLLRIKPMPKLPEGITSYAHIGTDGTADILPYSDGAVRRDIEEIETDYFVARMNAVKGIYSVRYKPDGTELIRQDSAEGAFAGIYEVTEMQDPELTRKAMGRRRRSAQTQKHSAVLKNRRITETGELFTAAELDYELCGTGFYTVCAKIYHHLPRIEVTVRLHKQSSGAPENLFAALPFTAGENSNTYLDKTACIIRPGIDQLPGSCQDFYMLQNGIVWKDGEKSVALAVQDAPLTAFGELSAAPVVLCSGSDWSANHAPVYSWLMNNFWETNFRAELGGFYEFRYTLSVNENKTPEEIFRLCAAENEGFLVYRKEEK